MLYHLSAQSTDFGPSSPLISGETYYIYKYPSVAQYGDQLWLFWVVCDESGATPKWSIQYRQRQDARWSATGPAEPELLNTALNPFIRTGSYDASVPRRSPQTIVDANGRLWLFWLEQIRGRWQLHYNQHDGANWGEPILFPLDSGADARIFSDLQVTVDTDTDNIYVCWSRQADISTAGLRRSQVVYRVKANSNFDGANWSPIRELPKDTTSDNHHDREAYLTFTSTGQPEVFWSSDRADSGWSIWRGVITNLATNTWDQIERITPGETSQYGALPIPIGNRLLLFYRSNRHVTYQSDVYRSAQSHDLRYSGSTALKVRHVQKNQLNEVAPVMDSQCYTYDTGENNVRDDADRIARDTVGVFLQAQTYTEEAIAQEVARLRPVVAEFMPVTDRAVFIPLTDQHSEFVYSYSLPSAADARFISETYYDEIVSVLSDPILNGDEDFTDILGGK